MAEGHYVQEQKPGEELEADQVEQHDCDSDFDPLKDNRLHLLCKEGRYKEVEAFIRASNADFSLKLAYRRGEFGYTPIHEAVSNGYSKVLNLLLEHGGDPNCCANSGYTPLHLAVSNGNVDCVRVLLDYNADISVTDEYGKTPVQTQSSRPGTKIMKILRSAGEYLMSVLHVYQG